MARKKRRSSAAGLSGAEKQEQRQKRLEEKREARAEALQRQRKQERRERFVRLMFVGLLAVGAIWFFFLRTKAPTEIGGHELLASSQSGEGVHTDDPVQYDTVPPVAGPHAPGAAPCGVFAEQLPNENLVHTLEHGAIGLLFRPDLDIEQIRTLEDIVGEFETHVFSAPFAEMDSPITITSWGFRMPLDEVDEPAIQEFIDEFRQKGPEEQPCPSDSEAPFQEGGATDTPGAEVTIPPDGQEETPAPEGGEGTPTPDES
jgi:hypothetical protein